MNGRQVWILSFVRQVIVSPARPFPLLGGLTQPASDGIVVKVIDRCGHGLQAQQVAIVAAAFLLEAKRLLARSFTYGQFP